MPRHNVLFGLILIVATCSSAPSDGLNHAPMDFEIPEECRGKTGFCYFKPKNYDELVERMDAVLPAYMKQEYSDRSGDIICETYNSVTYDNHTDDCATVTRIQKAYLFIKKSEDPQQNDTFDTLVQSRFFSQCIRTVNCKDEGVSSDSGTQQCLKPILTSDYTSSCVTTEVAKTLYIYDKNKNKIVPKEFFIPACCSCNIETVF